MNPNATDPQPVPQAESTAATAAANAAEHRELCPLSFAQERLWFLDQLQPNSNAYNLAQLWKLEGPLNLQAFDEAVQFLVRRHEILRTTFGRIEGKPVEVISAFQPVPVEVIDLAGREPAEVRSRIEASTSRPFHLQLGPLFRVELFHTGPQEHLALFEMHHIISDAVSFDIFRREFCHVYEARCGGRSVSLPELPVQYLDYAHWQREELTGERLETELAFWRDYLGGELPRTELPRDKAADTSAVGSAAGAEPFFLPPELADALRKLARREGSTLFNVLLAAFNTLLHRWTGQDDLVVGTPVSNRDLPEVRDLIGILVNTIPLRTRIDGNPVFTELVRIVRDSTFSAMGHHELPLEEMVKALQPERAHGENPLFQVVFAMHGGYPPLWTFGGLRATLLETATHAAKFDLTFLLEETDCGIKGRLEYKTDLFEADTIRRFLQQLFLLLQGVAANPDRPIRSYPLVTDEDLHEALFAANRSVVPYERDQCVQVRFEAQAALTPDAPALQYDGRRITYGELNHLANRAAHALLERGIASGENVGVLMERSPGLIVTLLAILKAGGAYVPIDPGWPAERMACVIQTARITRVITDRRHAPIASLPGISALALETLVNEAKDSSNPECRRAATDPAYVMFTSGSTGAPKGVVIPHRGIMRLVRNANYARFSADETFLQLAPASFDASTFEIWGALLNGARLVLYPPETPSLEELGRFIEKEGITTLWLTAGLFHQMIDEQASRLKNLRQLLAGGEALSVPHVLKALRELPQCRIINGYGPTENTTFTCCHSLPPDWTGGPSVPIGTPVSNTQIQILDRDLQPVPPGAVGELFAGGDGLAIGYLDDPELTQASFIDWAYPPADAAATRLRLYRTGDLVRRRPDRTLEFLGRKDRQIKIRGYRIEPGEVEGALMRHPGVQQAIVVAREDSRNDRQLVGYVTVRAGATFSEESLQAHLRTILPHAWVPSRLIGLESLPLTRNGKVDHRALPCPEIDCEADSITSPRDPAEQGLYEIWVQVLGRNSFGVHDDFFRLGGHSLLVTQMISRIARVFKVELPVRVVFETPTVAGLARILREGAQAAAPAAAGIRPRASGQAEARRLLGRLDQLSETEINSLLTRTK